MSLRVLVADDEPVSRTVVGAMLKQAGYIVTFANDGDQAWRQLDGENPPAIALLDWEMPGLAGPEVVSRIRGRQAPTPTYVILLTSRDSSADIVAGLKGGADDYVTKPFSTPELLARLRVALRHHRNPNPASIDSETEIGDLRVDRARHRVDVAGNPVTLTPKEFAFLALLATHPGRIYTHRMILEKVWGPEYQTETHYLRVYASQLRKKLGDDPTRPRLVTEPGVGYRLVDADQPDD